MLGREALADDSYTYPIPSERDRYLSLLFDHQSGGCDTEIGDSVTGREISYANPQKIYIIYS